LERRAEKRMDGEAVETRRAQIDVKPELVEQSN